MHKLVHWTCRSVSVQLHRVAITLINKRNNSSVSSWLSWLQYSHSTGYQTRSQNATIQNLWHCWPTVTRNDQAGSDIKGACTLTETTNLWLQIRSSLSQKTLRIMSCLQRSSCKTYFLRHWPIWWGVQGWGAHRNLPVSKPMPPLWDLPLVLDALTLSLWIRWN